MDSIQSFFKHSLSEKGISLSNTQMQLFEHYYQELVGWNEKINLTAITERKQVYMKHFYDSISAAFFLNMDTISIAADIGSGAGFPGIPLKIVYPHLKLTIIDSLNKRIDFLRHIAVALNLQNIVFVHARAEEAGQLSKYREAFDLVTARAVARMNVLNELCLPFAKVGGYFLAMKGADPQEEVIEAAFSMEVLKGELQGVHSLVLPEDEAKRHIIIIRKTDKTPRKFPRNPGTPAKNPLIEERF